MSIGGGWNTQAAFDAVVNAINLATTNGIVVVSATGNDNIPIGALPAVANNHIVVGSIKQNGTLTGYSNYGFQVDLVGISDFVNSTLLNTTANLTTLDREGTFTNANNPTVVEKGYSAGGVTNAFGGTSASAPQVSGVAALMKSINPNLSASEAESILKSTAKSLGTGIGTDYQGSGIVRACEAVFETLSRVLNISGTNIPSYGTSIVLNGLLGSTVSNTSWSIINGANKLDVGIATSGTGNSAYLKPKNFESGIVKIRFTVSHNCGNGNIRQSVFDRDLTIQNTVGNGISSGSCYQIKAQHSSKVLAVAGSQTTNGALVWQVPQNTSQANQIWKVETTTAGYYKLSAQHTGKVMDVQGGSTSALANIQQYDYLGGDNQQFAILPWGDGTMKIRPKHTAAQNFDFDIYGGSTADFAQAIQYPEHGATNQRFYFETVTCPGTPPPPPPLGGGGGSSGTCGMQITNTVINCNTGNPNMLNIVEAITVSGAGSDDLEYRADAGSWSDYSFHIQNLSPGSHTLYARKKLNQACMASIAVTVCGSGGGGGGGTPPSTTCPTAGCLTVSSIWYNHFDKVLEGVTVNGGTGQYQYAIDGCSNWVDYQWLIRNLSVGSHTVYVRDKNNITCGGQFTFNVIAVNYRMAAKDVASQEQEAISGITVYPNPTSKEIAISFIQKKDELVRIDLISMTGSVLKSDELLGTGVKQTHTMNVETLPSGTYVVNLRTRTSFKSKIIVKQ
jgi:Ricin-type beta-trefoil lectin domain-like/Subtilase family/Secretion system C-terminal sorting domain